MNRILSGSEFNKVHGQEKFIKLSYEPENYSNLQCQTGLNISEDFNKAAGGIDFCNRKVLNKWLRRRYGKVCNTYFRDVIIPPNAKIMREPFMFRSNKLILSEERNVWSDDDLCQIAVTADPMSLEFCENQTDDLCKLALTKNGSAIKFIKHQTTELCQLAVMQDTYALRYIKEQSDEICKCVIFIDPMAIRYVKNQTDEICKFAVERDGFVLAYIRNQTDDICKIAILNQPISLCHVINQTPEICELAVANNSDAKKYIKSWTTYLKILCSCSRRNKKSARKID
jgi:hypothetical protein